ncbi:MAG: thiamine diphosphokinase [Brevefilum fermentans]|jgi:thiamine pyrophosphokinase|uniref:Thiamine diphosphokinase n=1 Tax=Candidatus Brevifilum fermentans TaxID=1986204 RepID=A0A1Y6K1K2_9CHLR|nr:thiamine diphosphokinase [Brevefilum fermentans]SMX53572.1 Thiamine pyrophosphokinase [Brevefilum fermentans]HOM67088.1 thiamine diphosphokinase [Brevefilum fermentans]
MTHNPIRVFLFVNGELPEPDKIRTALQNTDYLIAVDGGLRHLVNLGLTPHMVIGDLDSADPDAVQRLRLIGVEIRTFPTDKDETDLHLALDAALELAPDMIRVVAALGGRLDQTLANIFLLTRPDLAEVDIRLIDGHSEVFLIRKSANFSGEVGQRVSLLPLNGPVTGIHTEGLRYSLNNGTLFPDNTLGISNEMNAPTARISIQSGLLLCIHETRSVFTK